MFKGTVPEVDKRARTQFRDLAAVLQPLEKRVTLIRAHCSATRVEPHHCDVVPIARHADERKTSFLGGVDERI